MAINRRHTLFFIIGFGLGGLFSCSTAFADFYVSAAGANSVMRFDGDTGQFIETFVTAGAGGLGDPQGISFGPDGNLYVSSNTSNNVLRFNGQTGEFIDVFATVFDMMFPAEINFRGNYLYVSDFATNGRVSRFDANTGDFVDHFITGATFADGQSWDANGDILVSSFATASVRKYDGTTGAFLGNFVAPGSGGLSGPLDNLILADGSLLVSSFNNATVKHYDSNGNFLENAISGLTGPQGLEIGPDGLLYAGSFITGTINRYDPVTFAFIDQFATTNGASTTNNFTFSPPAIPEPTSVVLWLAICSIVLLVRSKERTLSARTEC